MIEDIKNYALDYAYDTYGITNMEVFEEYNPDYNHFEVWFKNNNKVVKQLISNSVMNSVSAYTAQDMIKLSVEKSIDAIAVDTKTTAWAIENVSDLTTAKYRPSYPVNKKEWTAVNSYLFDEKGKFKHPYAQLNDGDCEFFFPPSKKVSVGGSKNSTLAILGQYFDLSQAIGRDKRYPKDRCPEYNFNECVSMTHNTSIKSFVIHMNDNHKWTREQVADELERLDINIQMKTPTAA